MAYNNDNRKGDNAKKRISYTLATFFSSHRPDNGEYQMVKIGMYDEKLTFNFYKGVAGSSNKMIEAFVKMDYEPIVALTSVFNNVIRSRVATFRSGEQYSDNIYFDYNISFTEAETKQIRSIGHLVIKTELIDGSVKVCFCYMNGTDEFKIVLGSPYIPEQMSLGESKFASDINQDIDLTDSRLYALAYLLSNISRQWATLVQQDIVARLMMNKFSQICGKLGINYGTKSQDSIGDGGNYKDSNYRSNGGDESEEDIAF